MAADKNTENLKMSVEGSRRLIEQLDAAQALHDAGVAVATAMTGVAIIPGRQSGVQMPEVLILEEWARARGLAESALRVIERQIARLQPKAVMAPTT